MITRIVVVDPENDQNLLVFQVPENSRTQELLCYLLDKEGIEWAGIQSHRRKAE